MTDPVARRWNHTTHRHPAMLREVPADARVVLDVGCGEGTLARALARAGATPGRQVLGIDTDPTVLPRAAPDGVRFAAGDALALPCADGTVDAVTMAMVLHHVDAAAALAEVRRVLRPGGTLVLLGYGRSAGPVDALLEVRDVLVHRARTRCRPTWEPTMVRAQPPLTWAENRRLLRRALPGVRYRRLAMWRYLAVWRAPVTRP
jgi:ubiquinone/menaquinone biosynthesis C-methylase UbiE